MANFPPSGLIEGVFADFGEFNECLDINSRVMRGQYCLAKVNLPFPSKHNLIESELETQNLSFLLRPTEVFDTKQVLVRNMIEALNIVNGTVFQLGVCLPSVCSPQEVQNAINKSKNNNNISDVLIISNSKPFSYKRQLDYQINYYSTGN